MIIRNRKALERARCAGPCEYCGLWHERREPHHLLSRGHGGGTRLDIQQNLMSLCPFWKGNDCHRLKGDDPRCAPEMFRIVAIREGFLDGDTLKWWLNGILALPKGSRMPVAPERTR